MQDSDHSDHATRMAEMDMGRLILGVAVWIAVAVFSVVVVANVESQLLGFAAVLVAVLVAWAIGERMVHPEPASQSAEGVR